MNKLNLGCGADIRIGWINLDKSKLPGVDVVHDINKLPLPFKDSHFDMILCRDILEHTNNFIFVMKDLYRILKPGGKLLVRGPHFTSRDAYTDPTHQQFFSVSTFDYFSKEHNRKYYFDFHFSKIKVKLRFNKNFFFFYNYLLEPLVNLNRKMLVFYEWSPLRAFPASNIEVELIK